MHFFKSTRSRAYADRLNIEMMTIVMDCWLIRYTRNRLTFFLNRSIPQA